jgi:hypothetical protein
MERNKIWKTEKRESIQENRTLTGCKCEFKEQRAFWFFFVEKKNNKKGLRSHLRPLNQPQEIDKRSRHLLGQASMACHRDTYCL